MGIGMALFEHTSYHPQNGAPINSNLADYLVTVNADAPPIDVHFLDYPDKAFGSSLGPPTADVSGPKRLHQFRKIALHQ